MKRGELAKWFWRKTRPWKIDFKSTEWKRVARDIRLLLEGGYSGDRIVAAVNAMVASGKVPEYPFQIKWKVPGGGGATWYDVSAPYVPPIWDTFAYNLWKDGNIPPRTKVTK